MFEQSLIHYAESEEETPKEDQEAQAQEAPQEDETPRKVVPKAGMSDSNKSRISLSIHTVVGIIVGWIAFTLTNTLLSGVIAIGVLIVLGFVVSKGLKQKGIGWWAGNGMIVYLFVFLITWIYFFNV